MMSRLYYALVWVQASLLVATVRGGPCNALGGEQVAITEAGGMLYSLNYPLNYEDGLTCRWALRTFANAKVVQIETIDIDVESPDGNCTEDYLAAYDGNNAQAALLKKWCRRDRAVVTSTGQSLFLKFKTNRDVWRRGFSIAYREITPFDASCKDGQLTTLTVGTTPTVYTLLHPKTNISECQWKFVAQGSNQLTLTVDTATGELPCDESYLTLHDGADASAPEILRWCRNDVSRPAPFSAFYPSGAAVIVLHVKDLSRVQSLSLQLAVKAHTRFTVGCTPVEVKKFAAPVFLAMPYILKPGGFSCPARFRPATAADTAFRVDVLKVNNQAVSCASTDVAVYQGDKVNATNALEADCWNNSRPMFLASASGDVLVTTQTGKTSVVQIVATDVKCTGKVSQYQAVRRAYNFRLLNEPIGNYGYTHFCVVRALVEAKDAKQHPRIVIASYFTENFDRPSTLKVYDGQNTKSPVVYNTSGPSLKHQVIGTGRYVLVELSTAGLEIRNFADGTFSEVPVTTLCNTVHSVPLTATSKKQTLTSINFPNDYPADFGCRYTISTNRKGEVVHLNVVDASFGDQCDDYLIVSVSNSYSEKDRLAYVCGGNPSFPKSMQSAGDSLYLEFSSSNTFSTIGSWKVEYFSAPPSSSKGGDRSDDDDNTAAIVGGVLGVIIAILIIVIIILVIRTKQRGNAIM